MKKHSIIALTALLSFAACQPSTQSNQTSNDAASAVSEALKPTAASAVQAASSVAATGEFAHIMQLTQATQQKLTNATPAQADQLYKEYHQQIQTALDALNTKHAEFLENYDDEKNWQNVASEPRQAVGEMKQRLDDLAAAQLAIVDTGMGVMQIQETPDFYKKIFTGKTSPDVAAYIQLQAHEALPQPSMADVEASWNEFGNRAAAWEAFMQQFPNSAYHADAQEKFNYYADLFLLGNDDAPVTVSNDPVLTDSAAEYAKIEKTWTDYAAKHPDSHLIPMFSEAKKIAHMQGKQGEERYLAAQHFRKVHFKMNPNVDSK